MASADSADELRPKFEISLRAVEGDLLSTLAGWGADGWQIVQLLPQPDGKITAVLQRRKLLIETATTIPLPILNG